MGLFLMLWADIILFDHITSDVINGMSLTQFIEVGHIAKLSHPTTVFELPLSLLAIYVNIYCFYTFLFSFFFSLIELILLYSTRQNTYLLLARAW